MNKRMRYKTNKIKVKDDYAKLIIYSADMSEKHISLIDLEDIEYVRKYNWCIRSGGYVGRAPKGKIILLHRVLTNCPDDMVVDHINGNKLDNRKSNLRICTHQENVINSKKMANNTSGIIGVGMRNDTGKWRAYIAYDGKTINLGCYKNKDEAIIERLKAEKRLFGEYSPQISLFKKYNI